MSFSSLFDGRSGMFLAAVIAICIIGLAIALVRRAMRRGVKTASGRRLGIVDAYDLDRHRQLVIIRRDNVEHLIMIGGPNDLVIESDIVRPQPMVGEPRREPMVAMTEQMTPEAIAAPISAAPPVEAPRPAPAPPMPRVAPLPTPRPAPFASAPDVKPPAPDLPKPDLQKPVKEPRLSVNINSLEEEMSRLLGRPPEQK